MLLRGVRFEEKSVCCLLYVEAIFRVGCSGSGCGIMDRVRERVTWAPRESSGRVGAPRARIEHAVTAGDGGVSGRCRQRENPSAATCSRNLATLRSLMSS